VDLYRLILAELVERKCAYVHKYAPYYIISIGCHLFNIMNRKEHVWVQSGFPIDTRLHIMLVAPPGFSKSFWIEQFLRPPAGIVCGSGIPVDFEAAMTEAGFVGTIKYVNGEVVRQPGVAEEYKDAIIGIEEFAALTEMMQQQYSRQLDTALLLALDKGSVCKRLAAGEIKYTTNVTLFTGTQPARFNLTQGLGRRILFLQFIPTLEDFKRLKKARRQAMGRYYNPLRMETIRKGLRELPAKLKRIESVELSDDFNKFIDRYGSKHFEDMLYERIGLGYWIMRGNIKRKLTISLDTELQRVLFQALVFRREVQRGSEYSLVIQLLREAGGHLPLWELKDRMLAFGMDWKQSTNLINELYSIRAVTIRNNVVYLASELNKPSRNSEDRR